MDSFDADFDMSILSTKRRASDGLSRQNMLEISEGLNKSFCNKLLKSESTVDIAKQLELEAKKDKQLELEAKKDKAVVTSNILVKSANISEISADFPIVPQKGDLTKTKPIETKTMAEIKDKEKTHTDKPTIRYEKSDKGPYIVYVDLIRSVDPKDRSKPINQMKLATILNNIGCREINCIKKIGFARCKVIFNNNQSANWLAENQNLKALNLKAHIPPGFIMKFGLIFGVPTEFSEEDLLAMVVQDPMFPVHSIERIKRRNRETKNLESTTRIKVGFKSQIVPEELRLGYSVMDCKYYIPNIRQCFRCQKFGHNATNCKSSNEVCVNCSGEHPKEKCTANFKCCANCHLSHPAISKDCPARARFAQIHQIMTLQNLNFNEAKKQLHVPDFIFNPSDFPALGKTQTSTATPSLQQVINKTMVSHKTFKENFTPKKRTQDKYHIIDITQQYPELPKEPSCQRPPGPVFQQEIYTKSRTTAIERLLKELSKSVTCLIAKDNQELSEELKTLNNITKKLMNEGDLLSMESAAVLQNGNLC